METNIKNIDYQWLTRPTGDPFADAGGYTIQYLLDKFPEKDIMDLIEYVTKIYVHRWNGNIYSFFLNSTITQSSFKGEKKINETIKYFKGLINDDKNLEYGLCRITGEKTNVYKAGRDNSIMTGSGAFVNFHHSFQSGLMLSKEMIIRMFFVPFGTISIGGKIAIIQTNNNEVNAFFIRKNCELNEIDIATSNSKEILKSNFGIPANALFKFVDDLFINKLVEASDDRNNLSITLYHFTNFAAKPEITLYKLPSFVFRFYSTCQSPSLKADWQKFILSHYSNSKHKNAKYNEITSQYDFITKNSNEHIDRDNYSVWYNVVLSRLLANESILRLFLKWGIKHTFNFKIVELYQIYINNMKPETLNKIKELAEFLTNEDEDTIKKTIKALDGYKSAYDLRRFFLKNVVAKNYKDGGKETIITMEELVYYLFPDNVSWRDIRDILLFAIYQKLHAKNITVEADILSDEDPQNDY